jgi:DNA-binding PadR family transcriptional regulator
MDSPKSILGDFSRFYILLLLFEGPKHGYDIIAKLEERLGQRASPSLVYPFLKQLEESKVIAFQSESTGRRKRKKYSLTKEGIALCSRLFNQFTTIVSSAIEPSMSTCSHCGCKVYKDAHFEEINGKKLAFCCKYCASSYKETKA